MAYFQGAKVMGIIDRRPICNNNPESAPVVNGKPFILCWRCCGTVVGLLLLLSAYRIHRFDVNAVLTAALIVPASVDWLLIRFHRKNGNNSVRFATGALLGISIGMLEISLFY